MKPRHPTPAALHFALLLALGGAALPAAATAPDALAEVQDLYKAGRSADAMRRLDVLIAARPSDPRLRFQKGVMLVDQKRPNEAIQVFQKLVQDFPALPEPMNNLAVLYVERGDMEKARTTLEAAIRSKPNYGTAFQNLGDLYTRMASRAYARALQIDESDAAPKLALIRNLYEAPEGSAADVLVAQAPTTPPPRPVTTPAASAVPSPAASPAPPPAASRVQAPASTPPAPFPAPAPKPAPAPPPPPPAPAPAKPPVKTPANDEAEVTAAVRAWAAAWSRRDLPGYFSTYQNGFKGGDGSAEAWQAARRDRIAGKASIRVGVSNLKIKVDDGVATASFRQSYSAGALDVNSRKTLELVKVNGRWLIRRESVGG